MTDWTDLEPRLAPERSAQLRAGLLTEITRRPARARRRFTGIAITAAATLTVAGTAAAWVAMTRPASGTRRGGRSGSRTRVGGPAARRCAAPGTPPAPAAPER